MKSTVETLGPTRVRLAIEVPFAELEPSLRKVYREIASQENIRGFRKGKVPPIVIDQRFGRGAVLDAAVKEAIPTQIIAAVREHEVRLLGQPSWEITEFTDGEVLKFTAELDVRPEITLPDLTTIAVTVDEVDAFTREVRSRVSAGDHLSCVVAKVDAIGPKSFHMDLHLLENRFEFARALRVPGHAEP